MMKSLNEKSTPQLATYKECTGCFACAEVCPQNAIDTFINFEGHFEVSVDPNKCIHCAKCEKVCIIAKEKYGCNDLSQSSIYAGYATDVNLRRNATSGGVFAAIAKMIIENGGAVAGASFDGTYARHILINRIEDIEKLQGSKYTPSSMKGIYKEIESVLPNRKVLFSGTGCQVAGILSYFEGNSHLNNLITVDLICGGVPSIELIRKFNKNNNCKIKSFRNKNKYELSVESVEGDIKVISGKNLPIDGFAYEMTNRLSCYDCQFAFCHRKSDITIGDLWDYAVLPGEHEKGVSMVLLHSEKARDIISSTPNVYLEDVPWQVIKKNYRVVYGKGRVYRYRKELANSLKKMQYSDLMKTYALSIGYTDIRLVLFKLYRHLMYKHDENIRNKYITSLLEGK